MSPSSSLSSLLLRHELLRTNADRSFIADASEFTKILRQSVTKTPVSNNSNENDVRISVKYFVCINCDFKTCAKRSFNYAHLIFYYK